MLYNIFKRGSLAVEAACPDSHPRVPVQQRRSRQINFGINTVLQHLSQITKAVLLVGHQTNVDGLCYMLIKKEPNLGLNGLQIICSPWLWYYITVKKMCNLLEMHFSG